MQDKGLNAKNNDLSRIDLARVSNRSGSCWKI
jgi:hypothetical protein